MQIYELIDIMTQVVVSDKKTSSKESTTFSHTHAQFSDSHAIV